MANDGDKILLLGGAGLQDEYSNDILSWKNGADEWELEETKLTEQKGNGPQALKIQSENLNCLHMMNMNIFDERKMKKSK